MDVIPAESFLEIVSHMPLPSLIASLGVSKSWRALVPNASLLPARRRLLKLYLDIISSPAFPYTRPWILANLRPFNRQGYIDAILAQYPYIPEAFRIWILEWPARAVIWRAWPGLPRFDGRGVKDDSVQRLSGINWMEYEDSHPEVSALAFNMITKPEYIPVLCVWEDFSGERSWLVLDEREIIRERVYVLMEDVLYNYLEEDEDEDEDDNSDGDKDGDEDGDEDDDSNFGIYQDWIACMEHHWKHVEANTRRDLLRGPILPSLESPEIEQSFRNFNERDQFRPDGITAPPWLRRNDPDIVTKLSFM